MSEGVGQEASLRVAPSDASGAGGTEQDNGMRQALNQQFSVKIDETCKCEKTEKLPFMLTNRSLTMKQCLTNLNSVMPSEIWHFNFFDVSTSL